MEEAVDARAGDSPNGLVAVAVRFAMSSIGAKMVMALTGFALWGFMVVHLAANLQMFAGPDGVNSYGASLREMPALLWGARSGLIAAFVVHIASAIRCVRLNRAARPTAYAFAPRTPVRAPAVTMALTGLIVLSFLAYHIAHFTWRLTGPQPDLTVAFHGRQVHDVFSMVLAGFQVPWIAAFYVVGQLLLASHLSHGLYSMFQHLGLHGEKTWKPFVKTAAIRVAWGMCAAFCSIPLAVLL